MGVPVDFDTFCRAEYPRLLRAVELYCGDRSLPEDAVHDALVKVASDWRGVAAKRSPLAWTTRVAVNNVNTRLRRHRAEQRAYRRTADAGPSSTDWPQPWRRVAVMRALQRLDDRQRAVLVFRFFLQYSVAETSAALNVPAGTVKSDTHRALAKLRGSELLHDPEVSRCG